MPVLYFLGADDSHRLEEPRPIQFHRADDEPHPYAHVSEEEAESIAESDPDLYAVKGAPVAPVSEQDDETPTPKASRKRKAANATPEA